MKIYLRKKIKEERAAVSLLVFITVLTFVAVLLGAFLTVSIYRKTQLQSNLRIQEVYGKDVNRVDEIYEQIVLQNDGDLTCMVTNNITNDTNITYKFTFNKPVIGFTIEDIDVYIGNNFNTSFGTDFTLSNSSPAYSTVLNINKRYVISFDYKSTTAKSQEFEIGLYSDTATNLPTKKINATDTIQHEDYEVLVNNEVMQFKILAQIQDNNNIIVSNFYIIEIQEVKENKKVFVKNDELNYTLVAQYNANVRYVVIVEEDKYTDLKGNKNNRIINII